MAKRQRLAPARLGDQPPGGLETKSAFPGYPDGVWRPPSRAPIAGIAGEAAATAALAELAETLAAARREGRLIQALPLDAVDEGHLVRDRLAVDPAEVAALTDSLRSRGQQAAIDVVDLGGGRYGLITGWRRLTALRALAAAGAGPGHVLAVVRPPGEMAAAYRAMVEENEIRAGLSFYERARIVVKAVDTGVYRADRLALADLFAAAPAARRSKIGTFVRLVRAFDGVLRFPAAIAERAGLALAQALAADPGLADRLGRRLAAEPPADAAAEARAIAAAVADLRRPAAPAPAPPQAPDPTPAAAAAGPLAPGLDVRRHADGSLTLSGARLADPAFRRRLFDWLRDAAGAAPDRPGGRLLR